MLTSLLSFLGGSVFRMLWGEIAAWLTKRQEHAQEMERLRLQADLDAAQHERNQAAIRLQADLGVREIRVQAEAAVGQVEAEGWLEAIRATGRPSGLRWVDAWNAVIRPAVATWAVVMLTIAELGAVILSENAVAVCSAALGIYLAERNLIKRGK